MSCCNYRDYDNAFNLKLAQKELQDYKETGLKKSSQPLMEVLQYLPMANKSLLDIGGGVGAITFELFKKDISHATHVDISSASVDTFREELNRRSLSTKVNSLNGDFVTLSEQIPNADLVVLDKVLCCYRDFEELVSKSVDKANHWYVFSIPRTRLRERVYFFFDGILNRIKGEYIPLYFHPVDAIEKMVATAGFDKKQEKLDGKWRIFVFQK